MTADNVRYTGACACRAWPLFFGYDVRTCGFCGEIPEFLHHGHEQCARLLTDDEKAVYEHPPTG